MRDENGHWLPGYSGNPTGRPSVPADVRQALKEHTPKAVEVLAAGLHDDDPRVRIVCAKEILDRSLGRPAVANVEDEKGRSIQEVHLEVLKEMTRKGQADRAKLNGQGDSPLSEQQQTSPTTI